ncbi:hypothetical protein QFC19_004069 [Naganishia cerealis]|uniref:Uncharacterized protein n=1 Tax=Naganishia cerealis TaxID=610337 RepID=A0ACC2W0S3_9TREE|nr:hypothetical protein QFC19_004069 [Naganishia cerealis]
MRVTDDGQGIAKDDLEGGLGCERGISSKYHPGNGADDGFLGCRGEALAAMGTLAALEIISRREGFATTYHKSIKNGKVLSFLSSEKYAKPNPGTSIMLKDIYHSVRVKRNLGSKSSSTSIIQECKKALEVAILGWASNPASGSSHFAITLTLEEDPFCGVPAKRVLEMKANTDIVETFARLFGLALTETAKSFRASSQGIQIRGFVSFVGHPTRAHQYIFINGNHVEILEMRELVEDIFKSHGILDSQEDDKYECGLEGRDRGKLSGKISRQSMKPVFLLHLMLPKSELIHGLRPLGDSSHLKQVFPKTLSLNLPNSVRKIWNPDARQAIAGADTSLEEVGMARIQFSKQDLSNATFLSQIDNKFICCAIPHRDDGKTLFMIDQHAADERIRVERFLGETLRDFQTTKVISTLPGVIAHTIKLPLEQVDWLLERPERLALFEKWGFQISVATDPGMKTANYGYISVNSVPALLISRLGSTGGKDVKDIIAGYIAFLQTQPDGCISSLVKTLRTPAVRSGGVDNDGLLRWMPKRMKELIDSKACRGRCMKVMNYDPVTRLIRHHCPVGAIMFNDPLTVDKRAFLIEQLSKTSFPFICAHGRPSIFPVGQMPPCSVRRFSIPIDWSKQILE